MVGDEPPAIYIDGDDKGMSTRVHFIIPTLDSPALTELAIRSFEKFKSENFEFVYHVIENAISYHYNPSDSLLHIRGVKFYHNPTDASGSDANAEAIAYALKQFTCKVDELLFICHNDVMACHPGWMDFLASKLNKGNHLYGTVMDNTRIKAVHISGLLLPFQTFVSQARAEGQKITISPVFKDGEQVMDVGDGFTETCQNLNWEYGCCKNTHNGNVEEDWLDEKFKDFKVDRAINDEGDVIFLHLGRGTPKNFRYYDKPGRVLVDEWFDKARELKII